METEYYFITDDGYEITSSTFAEAQIMADYYGIDDIKSRKVFVDCAARDGNL